MPDYVLNSADSHVTEPPDLWHRRLDARLRELAPRVKDAGTHDELWLEGQFVRRMARGDGDDARETAGGHEPAQRLRDLDADGVWSEVLYPSLGLFIYMMKDPGLVHACCRIYNDWLHEQMLGASPRFLGTALVALHDVDEAVAEIDRCAGLGYRAANLPVYAPRPYNSPELEPVWERLDHHGMLAALHVGTGQNPTHERGPGAVIINYTEVTLQAQRALTYIISSGVLERHPTLNVAVVEGGASWLAALVERMDEAHAEHAHWIRDQLPLSPGDYVRRQVHVSFQHDSAALETLRTTGAGAIMFGTDYPHYEGTWPNTRKELAEIFEKVGGVSDDVRHAVSLGNVQRLYGAPPHPGGA